MRTPPSPLRPRARRLPFHLLLLPLCVAGLPAAPETWTNLDGQTMSAEFKGLKNGQVSFQKEDGTRYTYPYEKLAATDRARIDDLAATTPPEPEAPAPIAPGQLTKALSGKVVALKGNTFQTLPAGSLDRTRHYAIYYSAQWCPPCRAFTPELVSAYNEIKAAHPEFELIFVNNDEDEPAMRAYMADYTMPWPALRHSQIGSTRALARPKTERGIPNLVFMDADGKDLATSYDADGEYQGPGSVLHAIRRHYKL